MKPEKAKTLILEVEGGKMSLTVIQQVTIRITGALDAKGNALPVPSFAAPPTWAASNADGLVTPAADGLSCVLAGEAIGSVIVTATGTPAGANGAISGSVTEQITAAAAVSLALTVDPPVLQTPPTPPPPPAV